MREIAKAAGMRQASLYYHFPSKEQPFVSVEGADVWASSSWNTACLGVGRQRVATATLCCYRLVSLPTAHQFEHDAADMPSLSESAAASSQLIKQSLNRLGKPYNCSSKSPNCDVQPKLLVGFVPLYWEHSSRPFAKVCFSWGDC